MKRCSLSHALECWATESISNLQISEVEVPFLKKKHKRKLIAVLGSLRLSLWGVVTAHKEAKLHCRLNGLS